MKNKIILILFALVTIFYSCQKTYDNGPFFSLTPPLDRINGSYKIKSITENGVDQMFKITPLNIEALHFSYTGVYMSYGYDFGVSYTDTTATSLSFYKIINDDTKLTVDPISIYSSYPDEVPTVPLPGFLKDSTDVTEGRFWEILKLTQKKVWLKTTFHDMEIEVHLEQ